MMMKNDELRAEEIIRLDALPTEELLDWAHSCHSWLSMIPEHWTREHLVRCIRHHWKLDDAGMFWIERN